MDELLGLIETEDGPMLLKRDTETGYQYTELYTEEDNADDEYQDYREYSF